MSRRRPSAPARNQPPPHLIKPDMTACIEEMARWRPALMRGFAQHCINVGYGARAPGRPGAPGKTWQSIGVDKFGAEFKQVLREELEKQGIAIAQHPNDGAPPLDAYDG